MAFKGLDSLFSHDEAAIVGGDELVRTHHLGDMFLIGLAGIIVQHLVLGEHTCGVEAIQQFLVSFDHLVLALVAHGADEDSPSIHVGHNHDVLVSLAGRDGELARLISVDQLGKFIPCLEYFD